MSEKNRNNFVFQQGIDLYAETHVYKIIGRARVMKIREGCIQLVLTFITNFQSQEVMVIEETVEKNTSIEEVIQRKIPEAPAKSHVYLCPAKGRILWFLLLFHLSNL